MSEQNEIMDARQKARLAIAALEEKKGEEIHVVDISEVSVLADYFIIASGANKNQLQAMRDAVDEKLSKAGYEPKHIEGFHNVSWILMDYGDVVIHIFDKENRLFYDLERIWRDGKLVDAETL